MGHKPTLKLNLKRKWFDMILLGTKREEYREVKRYWSRIFLPGGHIKVKGRIYHPTDVNIEFSNGYAKNRRKFVMTCEGMRLGYGTEEWGAEYGKQYHVLTLGHLEWSNC